jgi:hypothetical protein
VKLAPDQERRLRELARMIAAGGAWRFLRGPVVSASTRDYPDAWKESREGVARALGRTLWHAHVGVEASIVDARAPAMPTTKQLRRSHVELAEAQPGRAVFHITAIGNDDVAGMLAHEVGRAYLSQLDTGAPFRTAPEGELPDAEHGSIAAVYLGLGVVALNGARYWRKFSEVRGRSTYSEEEWVENGGLSLDELAFLVAVQATVRDDVLTALDTLHREQADAVAKWREVLDDHEDDLCAMLAVGEVDKETPPARAPAPAKIHLEGEFAEGDLVRPNVGRPVFRYVETRGGGALIGSFVGFLAGVMTMSGIGVGVGVSAGLIGGFVFGRRRRYCRCASCGNFVTPDHRQCGLCGGNLVGEIDSPGDRLDAEEAYEDAQQAGE